MLGHLSLAVAIARRGYDAAERLGDPAMTTFAAMTRAGSLDRLGARHRAARVLGDALVMVEPAADPTAADNGPAQAAGMLHLASAQFASRNDPVSRDLVLTLERRARRQIWELDSLGNRLGTGSARSSRSVKT